jgi:uncharacterized protein YacL
MNASWLLIPDKALIVVIAVIGLALIVRRISRRTAAAALGGLIVSLLLKPFIAVLFDSMPPGVSIALLPTIIALIIRAMLSRLSGGRAAGHSRNRGIS